MEVHRHGSIVASGFINNRINRERICPELNRAGAVNGKSAVGNRQLLNVDAGASVFTFKHCCVGAEAADQGSISRANNTAIRQSGDDRIFAVKNMKDRNGSILRKLKAFDMDQNRFVSIRLNFSLIVAQRDIINCKETVGTIVGRRVG
ncbi:MAG: hypothetical protein K5653_03590, partial [Clostridiales bacterium]|nr:hypothetical protein [Clostridiales bacterium]